MKVVCDELGHNTATIFAIMKKLLSEMKMVTPDLKHIHYYTDSPTLQYQNKSIFYIVSRHKSLFDVSASWNYFEAGHRKGPCDGVGGLVKRMADKAVKQQKVVIEDAQDFFSCTQAAHVRKLRVVHLCFTGRLQGCPARDRWFWRAQGRARNDEDTCCVRSARTDCCKGNILLL